MHRVIREICDGEEINEQELVIGDDESVRRAFQLLLQSADFDVQAFCSAGEFLGNANFSDDSCIILVMRMPGMTALDL